LDDLSFCFADLEFCFDDLSSDCFPVPGTNLNVREIPVENSHMHQIWAPASWELSQSFSGCARVASVVALDAACAKLAFCQCPGCVREATPVLAEQKG